MACQVGRGEHVAGVGQEARDAADEDGQDHRARDPPGRVGDLLGHVTAGLEAVEEEQAGERGGQERADVARVAAGAHGVEEDRERLLAAEEEQEQAQGDDADQLGGQPDAGDAGEHAGAAVVDDEGDDQQAERGQQDDARGGLDAEEGGDEPAAELRDGRDGHDDRPDVDPRDDPGVAPVPQPPGPRVDAAGQRVLGDDLAEDQRDQQLADTDDHDPPDRGRPPDRQAVGEQRVHADQRREVREAQGHVGPQAHAAVELAGVPEGGELGFVVDLTGG